MPRVSHLFCGQRILLLSIISVQILVIIIIIVKYIFITKVVVSGIIAIIH